MDMREQRLGYDTRLAMLDWSITQVGKIGEQSALALHDRISKSTGAVGEVLGERDKRIAALEARIAALESENVKRD
jgi:hypothetical protein